MIKIGEGAEAKIYQTRMFGRELLLKQREEKKYRVKELDQRLRKERTKTEARVMARLVKVGIPIPRLIAVGKFSIYMEELSGKLLKDTSPSTGIIKEIGEILGKMHEQNVAHGDFTPANIMLCKGSPYIIDFGLAEVTNSQEEKAFDLLLMKRSLSKEQYSVFEKYYSKSYSDSRVIINRLKEIEKRGRYQIRTLA